MPPQQEFSTRASIEAASRKNEGVLGAQASLLGIAPGHIAMSSGEYERLPAPAVQPTPAIRILLVEDHAILREGLRALLEIEADLAVIGDVSGTEAALEAFERLQPDLVMTDLALAGHSGIDLIAEFRKRRPATHVLVLTAHNTEEYIRAALNAGAQGYVLKDSGRADLLQAIRTVVGGRQYLCASVAAKVVSGFVSGREPRRNASPESLMTGRERQVLIRIALGQSNKVIARDLELSVKTVEKHRSNLMRKLTLHNAAAVTLFALRNGFIDATVKETSAVS